MGRLKLAMYISLDGVYSDPAWTGPFWNDELEKEQRDFLFSSEALLLGRITYELFAEAWPTRTDPNGFADKMNSMPKHVASRSLKGAAWNASIIKGGLDAEVRRLKEESKGDLLIYGSGQLAAELTRHNLIDHYRLIFHPVIVGSGKRVFDGLGQTPMRLLSNKKPTKTGVLILDFERAP
jgi:dihydrofolate reductase